MRTRKEWRSAWALVAPHTSMAQVLYALTVTTDTTLMHARRTDSTARIGSWEEFSSARARGTTDSTDAEGLALIAGDSAAVALDSTVAEAGSVDPVGAASVAETVLDGDSPAAAPAEDSLVEVLDEDPAVASEEVPWAAGSTAEVDSTAVAGTGNCKRYSKDIGTAGSKCCQPFFFGAMSELRRRLLQLLACGKHAGFLFAECGGNRLGGFRPREILYASDFPMDKSQRSSTQF
jgi:hypothetical protein